MRSPSKGPTPSLDPKVIAELEAFPRAQRIVRTRAVSEVAFESAARRIRQGIAFGVACRIEDDQGRILLVHPAPGSQWGDVWMVPGGGAERGERPRESVVREILEETGGSVRDLQLWKVYDEEIVSPRHERFRWGFLCYLAKWK